MNIFPIVLGVVGLIWAVVLFSAGFKIGAAIANRGKGKKDSRRKQDEKTHSASDGVETAYADVGGDMPPYFWTTTILQ